MTAWQNKHMTINILTEDIALERGFPSEFFGFFSPQPNPDDQNIINLRNI